MFRAIAILFPLFLFSTVLASECPSLYRVQAVLASSGYPFIVKGVEPVNGTSLCRVFTVSGEELLVTSNLRFVVEGKLKPLKPLRLSERELEILRSEILFSVGKGPELLLLTNPLCSACRSHRALLDELAARFRVEFVPVGFEGREFEAAVSAYCLGLKPSQFFRFNGPFKVCNLGKLKVWSVQAVLKRHGLFGTPVAVDSAGRVYVGADEIAGLVKGRASLPSQSP
ncbi:hypothetical protein [Thermovibrio ammonificans]|uniref:Thioredoxin-like fold domain-containing protein n=1 Tax=Thermovibrio ammonificans (strain DSM 15698 / JCM 12110 / HB-1) TaxID=648996 RepID=E8T4V6_THEA1|nr:hypothetical protein [Thermovibrio ammonificans]ADU96368.1 hypothetical protein Theam_0395 [Thermovibrio ammonificans HB-1]